MCRQHSGQSQCCVGPDDGPYRDVHLPGRSGSCGMGENVDLHHDGDDDGHGHGAHHDDAHCCWSGHYAAWEWWACVACCDALLLLLLLLLLDWLWIAVAVQLL